MLCLTVLSATLPLFAQNKNAKFKIVIDPGHGGKDGGCIGTVLKEKDLNLSIALKLGKLIEDNHNDVEVIYTRKTDKFIALNERTEIANRHKADLFVSIHADAIPRTKNTASAFGAGTFTLGTAKTEENLEVAKRENAVIVMEDNYKTSYQGFDPNIAESYIMFETLQGAHQTQSIQFASFIQDEFRTRAQRHDRQVRQAPYLVLKTAGMPAVLVEVGFLSNAKEEKFLATNEGKNKMASAIYHGFSNYKNSFDRHNQATTAPSNNRPVTPKESTATAVSSSTAKPVTEERKMEKSASSQNNNAGKVVYKVQFLSYHKKLAKGAPQLKGLWPVDMYLENGTYRYAYGETTNFQEITKLQTEVRRKFKDAFVVRFKDGKRITK